jgi:hypothetical protein
MTLSDGSVKSFAVPMEKFHELRYNTATVLRALGQVEALPVMKIVEHTQTTRKQDQQKEAAAHSTK